MSQEKQTFESWMRAVDAAVQALSYLSVYDLADQTFYDWYESGYTPKEAARETLENEGYPMDLLEGCDEEVGGDF